METEKKPQTWEDTVISVPNHSQSASCPYCGEEFGIESEIEGTRRDQAHETWQARQPEIDRLKAEIKARYRAGKLGEAWYWQGDGEDHLESTTCPILIEADELRALLAEAEKKGRKEVVEWIEANTHPSSFKQGECDFREFELKTWQDYKKDWGIE